ncbi:MAG TPA: hypothetical protein VIE65_23490 [Methylobacter sp.]|jgi:hypothetical protein
MAIKKEHQFPNVTEVSVIPTDTDFSLVTSASGELVQDGFQSIDEAVIFAAQQKWVVDWAECIEAGFEYHPY